MCNSSARQFCRPRTGWPLWRNVQVMTFLSSFWYLNMALSPATMKCTPDCLWHGYRWNGLWTSALYFAPSTLVIWVDIAREITRVVCLVDITRVVLEREHSHPALSRLKILPLSKYCLWHAVKRTVLHQELLSFNISTRSFQPAFLYSQALAMLLPFPYSLQFKSISSTPFSPLISCMQAVIIYQ